MMIEKETMIIEPPMAAQEAYKAKHAAAIVMTAKVSDVDYYRSKLRHYEAENRKLFEENAGLKKSLDAAGTQKTDTERRISEYKERISKLEKALVEATIR